MGDQFTAQNNRGLMADNSNKLISHGVRITGYRRNVRSTVFAILTLTNIAGNGYNLPDFANLAQKPATKRAILYIIYLFLLYIK